MGVRFEGKEGRSYNNPSIHPAVFERCAPGPGGRGILIGLLKRLSWIPETQRSSGSTARSGSDGRVFTLSLHLSPAAHWRKLISAFWSFWSPPKDHCPPAQASCLPPAPSVFYSLVDQNPGFWDCSYFCDFLIVINNIVSKLLNYVSRQSTC